jgi:hypothetical protein
MQFVYARAFNYSTVTFIQGNGYGTSSNAVALRRAGSAGVFNNLQVYMNTNFVVTNNGIPTGSFVKNWLCGTRTANNQSAIINSSVVTTVQAPQATILNQEIAEFTTLGQTANPNNLDVNSHAASGHGNNNFDNQLLRTYLINTFAALGLPSS